MTLKTCNTYIPNKRQYSNIIKYIFDSIKKNRKTGKYQCTKIVKVCLKIKEKKRSLGLQWFRNVSFVRAYIVFQFWLVRLREKG